jgi:hypothetical protein
MNIIGAVDLNQVGGFTTTRLSRRLLLQVAPSAETRLAKTLGHDRVLSAMIERYVALCNDVAGELDMIGQRAAAQHSTDLVGHFIETSTEQKNLDRQRGFAAARLDLMKADVLKNLDNRNLTIETVANGAGMSGRQAQRIICFLGNDFHRVCSRAAAASGPPALAP